MWGLKRSFHTNHGKYAPINESFGPWGTLEKKKKFLMNKIACWTPVLRSFLLPAQAEHAVYMLIKDKFGAVHRPTRLTSHKQNFCPENCRFPQHPGPKCCWGHRAGVRVRVDTALWSCVLPSWAGLGWQQPPARPPASGGWVIILWENSLVTTSKVMFQRRSNCKSNF